MGAVRVLLGALAFGRGEPVKRASSIRRPEHFFGRLAPTSAYWQTSSHS